MKLARLLPPRYGNAMMMRMTSRTVTFLCPFTLSEMGRELPPGTYTVETDLEQLPMLSFPFPAYRRVSTRLRLPRRPGSASIAEIVSVDRAELEAALAKDAMTRRRER